MARSNNIVDKDVANDLSKKCREALNKVLSDAGFEVMKAHTGYGDLFSFKIEAVPNVKNELGLNPNHPEVIAFKQLHELYRLPANALGVNFTVGRDNYRLIGLAAGRTTFPLAVEKEGKRMFLKDDPRVILAICQASPAIAPEATAVVPATPAAPSKPAPRQSRKATS